MVLEVICGSMFSGKTEELLRRMRRAQFARQKIQVFKPAIDTRYGLDLVKSHDQSELPSLPVKDSKELLGRVDQNTRVVGIDEAQFFDEGIVQVAQQLAFRGIRVIVAGLDMDFRGEPFGPMPRLLAIAETVTKLSAICAVCGQTASRSQRLIRSLENENQTPPNEEQILIGALEAYEPRCRFCHEPHPIRVSIKSGPGPGLGLGSIGKSQTGNSIEVGLDG